MLDLQDYVPDGSHWSKHGHLPDCQVVSGGHAPEDDMDVSCNCGYREACAKEGEYPND